MLDVGVEAGELEEEQGTEFGDCGGGGGRGGRGESVHCAGGAGGGLEVGGVGVRGRVERVQIS